MSVISINREDLSFKSFANKREALAEGNGAVIIASEEALRDCDFATTGLVKIYNALQQPDNQVKKFADRESAARRTYIAMRASLGEEVKLKPKKAEGKVNKGEKAAKAAGGARLDFKVKAANGNPFRIGTKCHTNFQKVVDQPGLTYAEYVNEHGVHAGILQHAIRLGHATKSGGSKSSD